MGILCIAVRLSFQAAFSRTPPDKDLPPKVRGLASEGWFVGVADIRQLLGRVFHGPFTPPHSNVWQPKGSQVPLAKSRPDDKFQAKQG